MLKTLACLMGFFSVGTAWAVHVPAVGDLLQFRLTVTRPTGERVDAVMTEQLVSYDAGLRSFSYLTELKFQADPEMNQSSVDVIEEDKLNEFQYEASVTYEKCAVVGVRSQVQARDLVTGALETLPVCLFSSTEDSTRQTVSLAPDLPLQAMAYQKIEDLDASGQVSQTTLYELTGFKR
jgi:hypothetical protein